MKRLGYFAAALALFAVLVIPVVHTGKVHAEPIVGETFRGVSTAANQWVSGGTPGACLTGAITDTPDSIPACDGSDGESIDEPGSGALRLTDAEGNQSGFAFYNTPISSGEGLSISFDMYQYGSTSGEGADGISFFLIDGDANPVAPGALGGSLGYSGSGEDPGLVGGYVGVGFDRFGNFSAGGFGNGGTGKLPNSIAVRGSEDSGYQFVTNTPASGELANEGTTDREEAKRHVVVSISTNNVMTIKVDYNDGQGLITELSNLDLNTINGEGTLPATFKFGFAASTGGSNNIHEISGLSVDPADPALEYGINSSTFRQDEAAQYNIQVKNGDGGQPTIGDITFTATLPSAVTPTAASGDGWACDIEEQTVTCTRPGSGANALSPGELAPLISIAMHVAEDAPTATPLSANFSVTTPGNSDDITVSSASLINVTASSDTDTVADSIEAAAPNDGDANNDGEDDADQETVTSLVNPVTNKYAVLETDGCTGNSDVSLAAKQQGQDAQYTYPAGLMDFKLTCAPGATATVNMYYFGLESITNLVLRKYNTTTQTYSTITGATFSLVTIGGQQATKVAYQITDGGALDEDGTANGTIVDPAGPAILGTSIAAPNTGMTSSLLLPYAATLLIGLGLAGLAVRRSYRAQTATR